MKAEFLYSGYDTFGRHIQVAKSESGIWLWREYVWNGFGNGYSKWQQMDHEPIHPKRIRMATECADAPEFFNIPIAEQKNRIEWGFNTLTICPPPHRVRLPI